MEKKLNTQHKDTRHDKGQFQKDSRGTKDGELVINPTKYRYIRALKNSMAKWRRTRAFPFSLFPSAIITFDVGGQFANSLESVHLKWKSLISLKCLKIHCNLWISSENLEFHQGLFVSSDLISTQSLKIS